MSSRVSSKTRIFLLAESRLLRQLLTNVLNHKTGLLQIVGADAYSTNVTGKIVDAGPDVLLVDSVVCGLSGAPFFAQLRHLVPGMKTIVIGLQSDDHTFLSLVRAGVIGYLLKDASEVDIIAAINRVTNGEAVCPGKFCLTLFEVMTRLSNRPGAVSLGLTRREQQLFTMISQGLTNKEIAFQLNLSEQTIKNHVHNVLRKLGVNNRLNAVDVCRSHGLLM